MKSIKKIYWGSSRVVMYILGTSVLFSGGTILYIAAPFTSYFFFSDAAFWKHVKHFHKIYLSLLNYIKQSMMAPSTGFCIELPLFSPPMQSPNPSLARLSAEWSDGHHDCAGCHICCDKLGCLLLDKDHKCLSYGSAFWRYFNCGRFPDNREQLEFYECPKWTI